MTQEENKVMTDVLLVANETPLVKKKQSRLKRLKDDSQEDLFDTSVCDKIVEGNKSKMPNEDNIDRDDSSQKNEGIKDVIKGNPVSKNLHEEKVYKYPAKEERSLLQNKKSWGNNEHLNKKNNKNKNTFYKTKNKKKKSLYADQNRKNELSNSSIEIGDLMKETFFNDDSAIKKNN